MEPDDDQIPMKTTKIEVGSAADEAFQKQIEKQNKEYFELRDNLSKMANDIHKSLLVLNNQYVPETETEVRNFSDFFPTCN